MFRPSLSIHFGPYLGIPSSDFHEIFRVCGGMGECDEPILGEGWESWNFDPITSPKWDRGPKFFPLWVSPPPLVCQISDLRQGVGKGEFLENSPASDLALEDQNGRGLARKTGKWYRSGSCAILSTNGAKVACRGLFFDILRELARGPPQTWPKFTSGFVRFCDFKLSPHSDCTTWTAPCSDCHNSTPITPSVSIVQKLPAFECLQILCHIFLPVQPAARHMTLT